MQQAKILILVRPESPCLLLLFARPHLCLLLLFARPHLCLLLFARQHLCLLLFTRQHLSLFLFARQQLYRCSPGTPLEFCSCSQLGQNLHFVLLSAGQHVWRADLPARGAGRRPAGTGSGPERHGVPVRVLQRVGQHRLLRAATARHHQALRRRPVRLLSQAPDRLPRGFLCISECGKGAQHTLAHGH